MLKSADVNVTNTRWECFYPPRPWISGLSTSSAAHTKRFPLILQSVRFIFQLTPNLLYGGINAPLPVWNVLPEELLLTAQQQQQQQQKHHFLDNKAVIGIFWRCLPARQTGVLAPLHVRRTGMSERLEKERQRGIVGHAGSEAPGLYKAKSFPWNKKKKKKK